MKRNLIKIFFSSTVVLFSLNSVAQNTPKIKYIFLFIGDGMGLNQVFLTEKYNKYLDQQVINQLNDIEKGV